ncbi:MAG: glycosyltransferase family 39 protein [Sulfurospirillaceae bacterium]|nr:glycosyltransferase family 39 protein [Sulfurospirillaceae bacterium]
MLGTQSLSISYDEAVIFFESSNLAHYLSNFSTSFFGQNDLALRLPFIVLHLCSVWLLYKIGKTFLKRKIDRIMSAAIYALLPGVNTAALLVNNAGIVIFLTLLFLYLYMDGYKISSYIVLLFCLGVDNSFSILYVSLFFYALFTRKKDLLVIALVLFGASLYIYGFDTGGKPKGYFLDVFGVYSTIFSPLLFLYFVYALYRILIKEEKNILWFISFVALLLSLLLSFRQRLSLEDFAPYVVIAIPLMVKVFFNSYRVRLPEHRRWHKLVFTVVVVSLCANFALLFLNKPIYAIVGNPSKHFAIKYHVAKELAQEIKDMGVFAVNTSDAKMALRLKFYGINDGGDYRLENFETEDKSLKKIDISYYEKKIATYYMYSQL